MAPHHAGHRQSAGEADCKNSGRHRVAYPARAPKSRKSREHNRKVTASPKSYMSRAAPVIAALATFIYAAIPAAADPPPANSGGSAQVAQVVQNPAYYPGVYNGPFYNAPVYTPLDVLAMGFGIYNAPVTADRRRMGGISVRRAASRCCGIRI